MRGGYNNNQTQLTEELGRCSECGKLVYGKFKQSRRLSLREMETPWDNDVEILSECCGTGS